MTPTAQATLSPEADSSDPDSTGDNAIEDEEQESTARTADQSAEDSPSGD
ncbi:MAG: hypothetical protein ABI037_09920 [Gemmatimonadales bacterium]